MAYQATRRKRLEEEFELVDESGKVVHTFHVSLDADDMIVNLNRKYTALTKAMAETSEMKRQAETKEVASDCLEKLGTAIIDLLEAVFGKDTQAIVDFYDKRYLEMSKEVIPFITTVIIPRLQQMRNEQKKETMGKYNRRKRSRLLGR